MRRARARRVWPRLVGSTAVLSQRLGGLGKPCWLPWTHQGRRSFSGLDVLPAVLIPPTVLGGLLVTLWTYKCLMMIIFQNKIIYMPFVPPFSRSDKVADYATQCAPVVWNEHVIKAADGVTVKLLEGTTECSGAPCKGRDIVVLYFQG